MTLDTAYSTGSVALHQAVQSLRSGEAFMSIVGGSNLTLNPDTFVALGSTGFLSTKGKSFAFDSRASGYGRGEGVATLVIKRLKDALSAGDPVRAVIRETLLNQDGKTDGITSPSQAAQAALMRDCYHRARHAVLRSPRHWYQSRRLYRSRCHCYSLPAHSKSASAHRLHQD